MMMGNVLDDLLALLNLATSYFEEKYPEFSDKGTSVLFVFLEFYGPPEQQKNWVFCSTDLLTPVRVHFS